MLDQLRDEETQKSQGVLALVVAGIIFLISAALWFADVDVLITTSVFAFALFIVGLAIMAISKVPPSVPMFDRRRLSFLLGLIPLGYAITVAFILLPTKGRIWLAFAAVFVALVISYMRDAFSTEETPATKRMKRFYREVAETHEALGVKETANFESVATRRVPLAEKKRLLAGMLRYMPWQLIVAFVLAIGMMIFMS
jgi:ABC-type multidrug transport system fused ATPase/permease subunit